MISCVIIDDEPLAVQLLEDHIRQTDFLYLVHKCHNAMDALAFLRSNEADLLFLDINMPKLTGMELVSLLSPRQKIIFTTAYSQYTVQSYEKNAVDYLLKPITFERFIKAVNKAEKLIAAERQAAGENSSSGDAGMVFVKSGKAIIRLELEKIICIEGLKDYVTIYTTSEKIVVYKRMKELAEELPVDFIRIHNSYIISIRHVSRMEDNHVLAGTMRIPVSEKYREGLLLKINGRLL
jgi:two-component system, LytTR family, response regulator